MPQPLSLEVLLSQESPELNVPMTEIPWLGTTEPSCGDDDTGVSSVGNVADGLDIANSGGTYFSIASLQFDASHFTFSNTASDGYVRLDWGDGGPASLSQDETVSGGWIFTNDIVANNSLSTAFAKFSSTSSGRFGLGDTTPEAFFEIASSSGVVASISN